jgi:hypothetical protein
MLMMALCIPVIVPAQNHNGNPSNWCRNGAFPEDAQNFKIAKVTGTKNARVYFYGDDDDCPNADEKKCQKKSYLIPGDQVIVSRTFGKWACSWYQPRRGSETVGWLPVENLNITEPDPNPPLELWIGKWKFYDQSLIIKEDGKTGFLIVEGEAYWHGLGDNVHVGEVQARAKPKGNELILEEEVCQVTLKLVGDLIVAADNSDCGGANVRFNGVYRKSISK